MKSRTGSILEKDWFYLALLGALVILFCNRIVFTDQIIRASDVITQFFWGARGLKELSLLQYLQSIPGIFHANWEPLSDGGRTLEGGWNAINFLFHRYLIQHFFPFPASIAWLAVLAMIWGAFGTFKYCRVIGIGRLGACTAGLLFVLCTENASLINAGHIQKLESICWLPWVILFLEKALRSRRFYYYALTGLMLAIQFFHMHWQISFYTCLAVGAYWFWHVAANFMAEKGSYSKTLGKEVLLAAVMVALFFSTIAMSFAPLMSWSQQSERGDAVSTSSASGSSAAAAPAQKGIGYDEGMSWSMPPEEILTYVVPGLFGYSRQEGGDVPGPDDVYYWGRMRFTQTNGYLGLLPWLLIPLPLVFRRDRYSWFFSFLMAATLIMALGKYTFVYRFMFDHLPAFSRFRVPKMILCVFAFGAAVMTGRGIDVLAGESVDRSKLKWWLCWCSAILVSTGLIGIFARFGENAIAGFMGEFLTAATRYQTGDGLVGQRYDFMVREAAIAGVIGSVYFVLLVAWYKKVLRPQVVLPLLCLLLLADLWRVDQRFFVVTAPPPSQAQAAKSDILQFLEPRMGQYRMQPMNEENAHYYADHGLANVSAYVTISERRYKEFLDAFALAGAMPDIVNLKYLVLKASDFQAQRAELGAKYQQVFAGSNGSVVLENRSVLPKAWLVPSVVVVPDTQQQLGIMSSDPAFQPARVALVETPPPLALAPYGESVQAGSARVDIYSPNRIVVSAASGANSLLVLGEKYYKWWYATVDGKPAEIYPVDHILRGVYLPPGNHTVEFVFDPLPFKIGKYVTLATLAFFALLFGREFLLRRGRQEVDCAGLPEAQAAGE
jgi:hypothetical protein